MASKGKFIVVIGPSASGKTTLVAELIRRVPNSTRLVTTTTRAPRPGEQHAVDYHFLSREEFEKRRNEQEFFESAEVYGNLYGSSAKVLEETLGKASFVFAVIDVKGAQTLKSKIPEAFTLFVRPSSMEHVERRVREERKTAPEEEILKRLEIARNEMALADTFDAVIVNNHGDFENTVQAAIRLLKEKLGGV